MDCDKGLYYDHGTNSCGFCSQLCHYVDIQGTRAECETKCPGYLQTTTESAVTVTTSDNPWFTAAIVLSCLVILVGVAVLGYTFIIPAVVRRLKKQDCCRDGTSSQPHTQETGSLGGQAEVTVDLLGRSSGQLP